MFHPSNKIISFLLSSHLFISGCTVGLSLETAVILEMPFQSVWLYTFIFFSTFFSYNFYNIKTDAFPYAKAFAIAGLVGAVISLMQMPYIPYLYLFMISIGSMLYLLPVFLPFKKAQTFSVQKLFLLILIWVMITFLFPVRNIHFDYRKSILLIYRIMLISHLCILFFIRDETNEKFKRIAIAACIPLGLLQLLICCLIALEGPFYISVIYTSITFLLLLISRRFNTLSKSNLHYLFFVDGIMLLQSIFVLLKFLIKS